MIEIIATAESISQAKQLAAAGVDTYYIGEETFGLRLPASFSKEEIVNITKWAHEHEKRVIVAVNGIFHNDRIKKVLSYVDFLQEIGVDGITVGDPGVIHLLKTYGIQLPYIYDAHTVVTSANQINFWGKRGASSAVLARELTFEELKTIGANATIPTEVLVYGATCIHHSKRPLLENYFQFTGQNGHKEGLFISEPKKAETHYSIIEDGNGTHIFATDDVNLLPHLQELADSRLRQWKLNGLFTRGEAFVEIAQLFVQAKQMIMEGNGSKSALEKLQGQLVTLHPSERTLSPGFYVKNPDDVK